MAAVNIKKFSNEKDLIEALLTSKICHNVTEARSWIAKHTPLESYYQSNIIKHIKGKYPGAFVWKASAGMYSRMGIPDVIACIEGQFFGFEVKRPFGIGVHSKIQEETIRKIRSAGGCADFVSFPWEVDEMIEGRLRQNEQ